MEGLCSRTTRNEKRIEGGTKHTFLQEKKSSRWKPSQVSSTCRQCCVWFVLLPLTHTLTLPTVPWLFYETDLVILYLNVWAGFVVEEAMEWEPAGYHLSPNFTTALDAARLWSALPQLMLSGTPLNRKWEFMGYAQSWRGQVRFPLVQSRNKYQAEEFNQRQWNAKQLFIPDSISSYLAATRQFLSLLAARQQDDTQVLWCRIPCARGRSDHRCTWTEGSQGTQEGWSLCVLRVSKWCCSP